MKKAFIVAIALLSVHAFAQGDAAGDDGLKFPTVKVAPDQGARATTPASSPAPTRVPAPVAPAITAQPPAPTSPDTVQLGGAPQLSSPDQRPSSSPTVAVAQPVARSDIHRLRATLAETSYPEVVRRDANGGWVPANIPVGWKLVPVRTLRFDPPLSVTLANGEQYRVEASPMALVPESNANRVAINPQALQVIYNFHLAQLDLLRQLQNSLEEKPASPIQP